jgi:hypothetical protein
VNLIRFVIFSTIFSNNQARGVSSPVKDEEESNNDRNAPVKEKVGLTRREQLEFYLKSKKKEEQRKKNKLKPTFKPGGTYKDLQPILPGDAGGLKKVMVKDGAKGLKAEKFVRNDSTKNTIVKKPLNKIENHRLDEEEEQSDISEAKESFQQCGDRTSSPCDTVSVYLVENSDKEKVYIDSSPSESGCSSEVVISIPPTGGSPCDTGSVENTDEDNVDIDSTPSDSASRITVCSTEVVTPIPPSSGSSSTERVRFAPEVEESRQGSRAPKTPHPKAGNRYKMRSTRSSKPDVEN